MKSLGEKEEKDREKIFLIFSRVEISKGIDTNPFKLTLVVPSCLLCINILNWGRVEEKIKHIGQRVYEIFFQASILFLLLSYEQNLYRARA